MSVIPTIETRSSAPDGHAVAQSKVSSNVSGGSCHVKSRPVGLDGRASGLWQQI
jgi:membrane fusion protein (multidrug efflux system)